MEDIVCVLTTNDAAEQELSLYVVEEVYDKYQFIRCSKSMVMNLMQLEGISPALSGRFFAHMKNGEQIIISRQYVPRLKEIVMGRNAGSGKGELL